MQNGFGKIKDKVATGYSYLLQVGFVHVYKECIAKKVI